MSQDIDDEPLFVIEESNVESTVQDVIIYEERYKDNTSLVLNREQITRELTGFFLQKNLRNTQHKVETYLHLIDTYRQIPYFTVSNIKPIIVCKKIITIVGDKKDPFIDATPEYFQEHFMVPQRFDTFITQFMSLNRDRSNAYLQSTAALYALHKPFVTSQNAAVERITKDTDAFRHFLLEDDVKETVRLVGSTTIDTSKRPEKSIEKPGCPSGLHYITTSNEHTVYEGDLVEPIGFFNDIDGPLFRFDLEKYVHQLSTLQPGQEVDVFFNEFVFDANGTSLSSIRGTMTASNIVRLKNSPIFFRGTGMQEILITSSTTWCFVYPHEKENISYRFCKKDLKDRAIVFNGSATYAQLIHPMSIHEYVYVYGSQALENMDINKVPKELQPALTYLHEKSYEHLKPTSDPKDPSFNIPRYINKIEFLDFDKHEQVYKNVYTQTKTFIDNTLNRYVYLKSKSDYGYLHILSVLKEKISQKISVVDTKKVALKNQLKKLQQKLEELQQAISEQSPEKNVVAQPKIVKEYTSYVELNNDQGRATYYDTDKDDTPYHLFTNETNLTTSIIIDRLISFPKYEEYTRPQLEKLAATIQKGKKRVRDGDYAVLHVGDGTDIMFLRRTVQDIKMWVKVLSAPFPVCDNMLPSFKDSKDEDIVVLDPFDIVCKKLSVARLSARYQRTLTMVQSIEAALNALAKMQELQDALDRESDYYHKQLQLLNGDESNYILQFIRRAIHIKLDVAEKKYESYIGDKDLVDLDVIYNNVDFVDNPGHYILSNPQQKESTSEVPGQDILKLFLDILDIHLETNEVQFILNQVNTRHRQEDVLKSIQEEEEKQKKKINKELYEKKAEYAAKADKLVATKVQVFEKEAWKKHYHTVVLTILTWIQIVLMSSYPNIVINKINPRCVKFFSYIGYPYTKENQQQSLTKFLACVLTTLASPTDQRFESFVDVSASAIESDLNETIDSILEASPELQSYIDANYNTLSKAQTIEQDFEWYKQLNISYKPNFTISAKAKPTPPIQYVRSLNAVIKKSNALKTSYNKLPSLINACCLEKLTPTINYFDFFHEQVPKPTRQTREGTKALCGASYIPPVKVSPPPIQPPQKIIALSTTLSIQPPDVPSIETDKVKLFLEDNSLLQKNKVFEQLRGNFDNQDWWDDTFYPALGNLYTSVTSVLSKFDDKVDTQLLSMIKSLLIEQYTTMSHLNLRNTLLNFIRFKLPSLLSRMIHKKPNLALAPEDNVFESIIQQLIDSPSFDASLLSYKSLFVKTDHLSFTTQHNEAVLVKNISVISYLIFLIFDEMIRKVSTTLDNLSMQQKKHMLIVTLFIRYTLDNLWNFILLNDNNVETIKQRMEDLREKRKQQLMGSYSADDEARKLQILLKKMGLPIEETNPDALNKDEEAAPAEMNLNQDILTHDNQQQEEANYIIADFLGENADQDEVEDEHYVKSSED